MKKGDDNRTPKFLTMIEKRPPCMRVKKSSEFSNNAVSIW